ncbi:phosphatidylinositol 3 [Diplocarpon rosae]|nr:phosphatidylinositol 3 [Diplocarpon rosae]
MGEACRGTTQKSRSDGMRGNIPENQHNLKAFFDRRHAASNVNVLSDKSYHKIYEVTFQMALAEIDVFRIAEGKNIRGTAATRLENCGDVVRTVIKAGAHKLKEKTVEAVVEHITQTLHKEDGGYYEPLIQNYLKALTALFEFQPNVERLKPEVWLQVVDFCIQGLNTYLDEHDGDVPRSFSGNGASHPSGSMAKLSHARKHEGSLNRQNIEELLQTLHLLLSAPQIPLACRYMAIGNLTIRLLVLQGSSASQLHKVAFSTLNIVLNFTREEHVSFCQTAALDILPVIYRLWQGKALAKDEMLNSIRDEMLTLIFSVHLHLERALMDEDIPDDLSTNLEEILEALKADYAKRSDRDQLQLDDLDMADFGKKHDNIPFSLYPFQLRPHNLKAERNWAILRTIGIVERLVSIGQHRIISATNAEDVDVDDHPRKRQRNVRYSDRLLEPLRAKDENLRLAGLQIVPFVLQDSQLPAFELSALVAQLCICAGDKRGSISAWALLAIASCASQNAMKGFNMGELMQLWHLGMRSLTFSATCRCAALELHAMISNTLVQYRDIAEDVGSIVTSADISGPVVLCDSSMFLMMDLLHTRVREAPGASLTTAQHVIRWMFARWNPDDGNFAARYSVHVQPQNIMALIRTCLGLRRVSLSKIVTVPCGLLAQAWQRHLRSQETIRYLLLLEDIPPNSTAKWLCQSCPNYSEAGDTVCVINTAHFQAARRLVLELLQPKIRDILQAWKSYMVDRSALVSTEMFRSAVSSCITSLLIMPHFTGATLPQLRRLETDLHDFSIEITGFLAAALSKDPKGAQDLKETLLKSIQPHLPTCGSSEFAHLSKMAPHMLGFFVAASETLNQSLTDAASTSLKTDVDMMDIDDDFQVGDVNTNVEGQKEEMPRNNLTLESWSGSFNLVVTGHLALIAAMSVMPDPVGSVPSSFVDHLLSLDDQQFMSSRDLLQHVTVSNLFLDGTDAYNILERLGSILTNKDYSRCEVAMGMCLDILIGLGPLWSAGEVTELAGVASQVYEWFITIALEKELASPDVQKSLAELLLFLLRVNPEYGASKIPRVESPRSSLFKVIMRGNISVKFYIGSQISQIFDLFILKDHEEIFADVLETLPKDSGYSEGISFRLFVLARLASHWPTLLRRCIYYLFEAPGKMPNCIHHATRCMKEVAAVLKVDGPKDLFALFSSQFLYTWLEEGRIEDIPFGIFGFASLRDLLEDAKEEATSLMIMRGNDKAAEDLARMLDVSYLDLLRMCFAKTIAYSVPYDMGPPPSGSTRSQTTGIARVKKQLGTDVFAECLNLQFADIIAVLFNTMSQEMQAGKYLMKEEALHYAAKILDQIISFGATKATLPPTHQPIFNVKRLLSSIAEMCKRTRHEVTLLYTPALVVSIARKLLNGIHSALGSLHACTVLRKLRVLIALAGKTATQGYPLEMLLRSMQTFIADPECAEDAIGITKYLMTAGSNGLLQTPTFVAGISLSSLGSLRMILESQKASTTQESQHKATVSKAQNFHAWLRKYLDDYDSPVLGSQSRPDFKKLVQVANGMGKLGNAEKESAESDLLIQLLKDERNSGILLDRPSRELALSMLSSEFRSPESFRTDVLGNDSYSIDYAAVVWKSCRASTSQAYLSWAARVMGRAFASSGQVHGELLQESTLSQILDLAPTPDGYGDSVSCILSLLRELTLTQSALSAGLAETALRVILSPDEQTYRKFLPDSLIVASRWEPYQVPPSDLICRSAAQIPLHEMLDAEAIHGDHWLRRLSVAVAQAIPDESLLHTLVPILFQVPGFSDRAFPFIIHLAISSPSQDHRVWKKDLSFAFARWFENSHKIDKNKTKMLLNTILYLRTQPLLGEKSLADRFHWLDIDFLKAAAAAAQCGMFKTSLLFAEEYCAVPVKSSRRSLVVRDRQESTNLPNELLLNIFENIDDPDMYYGVQQTASLSTILARFEHEKDGPKSLAFRGAQYDSHLRRHDPNAIEDLQSLVKSLDILNLNGISSSLLQTQEGVGMTPVALESMFRTARKLEQWDIPVPNSGSNNAVTIYKAFQTVHMASKKETILNAVNEGLESTMKILVQEDLSASVLHSTLQTLAALVEMDEILASRGSMQFEEMLSRFRNRATWMKTGRSFDDISQILSCRSTTLSTLSREPRLQQIMGLRPIDTRIVEVETALLASTLNRAHGAVQESLSLATSMMHLIEPCHEVGVVPEVAIQLEAANALWDQGEMASSIGMLQALDDHETLKSQTITVRRSELLTKIGYRVSVARLEKAENVIEKYLRPALKELQGRAEGREAGRVFHQFAEFCDQQLQDPDSLEDLQRMEKLTKHKADEVQEWEKVLLKTPSGAIRESYKRSCARNRAWLKIDREELNRQTAIRDEFLRQCLENYLLALAASDDHDSNALRFSALWMGHSEKQLANDAVSRHLNQVPSRKFAPLMNQLTSRLQDSNTKFQTLLFSLVLRICTDHPFHGMYQIYAGMRSYVNPKDESAVSRNAAATRVSGRLGLSKVAQTWTSLQTCSRLYTKLAEDVDKQKYKAGKKLSLKESGPATHLNNALLKLGLPPSTMQIPLSPNMDYSKLPLVTRLESQMAIASGVSVPKIITAVTNHGARLKQLVKGGDDDLRQDAIMEQVFEQVSELLKSNRSTRQRNLSIRTYRVLPLTNKSGVIEFVQNTIPIHDFLMPAHENYHPKDLKGSQCRHAITGAQDKSVEIRIKTYRNVTEKFQPAMRYFFTEKFTDPDEWYVKRLAYTRSTAAISILGHILGIGDRHGHNILLDAKSGEIVHIDLGIAFEMGRVLPVPELVPFRLTRDIVDGMGITKTEGVFRRCCEFTLEALRKENSTIVAILDVLRYDPLYSWSASPVRIAKIQQGQSAALAAEVENPGERKEAVNEPGEADRALTVVKKKLSKTLSITATVNDLINQATDERNLALLFSGWAAYA